MLVEILKDDYIMTQLAVTKFIETILNGIKHKTNKHVSGQRIKTLVI